MCRRRLGRAASAPREATTTHPPATTTRPLAATRLRTGTQGSPALSGAGGPVVVAAAAARHLPGPAPLVPTPVSQAPRPIGRPQQGCVGWAEGCVGGCGSGGTTAIAVMAALGAAAAQQLHPPASLVCAGPYYMTPGVMYPVSIRQPPHAVCRPPLLHVLPPCAWPRACRLPARSWVCRPGAPAPAHDPAPCPLPPCPCRSAW